MENKADVDKAVSGISVILAAFSVGVAGFAGVAAVIGPVGDMDGDTAGMLRYAALGLTGMVLLQNIALMPTMLTKVRNAKTDGQRLAAYRARAIVLAGSAEGAALLAAVVTLLCGFSWHAVPAYGLFAIMIALLWPTRARFQEALGAEPVPKADKYT
jgi:hypothetical protein